MPIILVELAEGAERVEPVPAKRAETVLAELAEATELIVQFRLLLEMPGGSSAAIG